MGHSNRPELLARQCRFQPSSEMVPGPPPGAPMAATLQGHPAGLAE
jgi:hypothetical protein